MDNGSNQLFRLVVLLTAQAMIAPSCIKLIWHVFTEISPLAHCRGKAEFFIGTRDDADAGVFLSIYQYFTLKETARKLDRYSNRKGLVMYSILVPLCFLLIYNMELAPANPQDYSEAFGLKDM